MEKRVFIIHGWGGTADSGWKGWLKKELEPRGFVVSSPQMPDAENPRLEEWLATARNLVGRPDGGCYFVGHSLGCTAILRYLERLGAGEKIGGAVLVAGLAEYTGIPELKSFFPGNSYDWKKIRQHCGKFVSINSDNDYYIPVAHGKEFELELGARLAVLHARGHFSSSEGTAILPEALEAVLEMAGK